MPLGHTSLSHGVVVFGFFNVKCDCLLLNNHFFFASDFCYWVTGWAQEGPPAEGFQDVYVIENPVDIGNRRWGELGCRHHGFLSDVYELLPFPDDPEDFRQQPEGGRVRREVEPILQKWATATQMPVRFDREQGHISLGEFVFDRPGFRELLLYVWRGGLPTWRDSVRPQYVTDMAHALQCSTHWPFQGMCRGG